MIQAIGQPQDRNNDSDIPSVYKKDVYSLDRTSEVANSQEEMGLLNGGEHRVGTIHDHTHDGKNSSSIRFLNLVGFIKVVSDVPDWIPKKLSEQMVIYSNGGTYRLYVYVNDDPLSPGGWRYTSLT